MMQILSDLCAFADGRVAVADLDLDSYISTLNLKSADTVCTFQGGT
jgi:hypothetical protein